MDTVLVFLQAAATLVSFIAPGLFILRRLAPRTTNALHPASQLSLGFICGSLLAGLLLALSWMCVPGVTHTLSWCWLVAACLMATIDGKAFTSSLHSLTTWERVSWILIGLLFLVWLTLLPLSPYPSLLSEGLGDRPGYYHVAENLTAGKGLTITFFVGDYLGGAPPYLTGQPFPVSMTAYLFYLFGVNDHSLSIYCISAGVLMILLTGAIISSARPELRGTLAMPMITSVFASIGTIFKMTGFGAAGIPGTMAGIAAVGLYLDRTISRPQRLSAGALCLLYMIIFRPESTMLGLMLAVGCPLLEVMFTPDYKTRTRLIVGGLAVLIGLIALFSLPGLAKNAPPAIKNLSIFYVEYNKETRSFEPMYAHWDQINRRMARHAFSGDSESSSFANPDVATDILADLPAFSLYLTREASGLISAIPGFTEARRLLAHKQLFICAAWLTLLLMLIHQQTRSTMLVCMAFIFLFPIVNINHSPRLLLPLGGLILTIMGYQLAGMEHRRVLKVCGRHWLPIAIIGVALSSQLRGLVDNRSSRTNDINTMHLPIIEELKKVAEPGDLIATSYPQLITFKTGHPSLGCSRITDNLDNIITMHSPDLIAIEDTERVCNNYTKLAESRALTIPGYTMVAHDTGLKYAIFKKD